MTKNTEFLKELEQLINRYSAEGESNTPDFILAQFLYACLQAWNAGVQRRELWYGRHMLGMTAPAGNTLAPFDVADVPTDDKKDG